MNKYLWLCGWLERWPDGTVKAYKTAVRYAPMRHAMEAVQTELNIRMEANGTVCNLYRMETVKYHTACYLIGKAEVDELRIGWPS